MEPVEFEEHNVIYAKDQPEYRPLPALKLQEEEGRVISCWRLGFWERIKLLFTGRLWVCLMTFNRPLTPSFFTVHKSDLIQKQRNDASV